MKNDLSVFSKDELLVIELADAMASTPSNISDELYSRLLYSGSTYTHLRAANVDPERVITIMRADEY